MLNNNNRINNSRATLDASYQTLTINSPQKNSEQIKNFKKSISDNDVKSGNFQQAELFFNKNSYRFKYKTQKGQQIYIKFQLFKDNKIFRQYGLGVYFYLQFMRAVGFLLLFCSIIAGVQISYNLTGTGLQKYTQSYMLKLLKGSLGNNTSNSESQFQILTICDLIYTFFLIIFIITWRCRSDGIITENMQDLSILNPQKYSLGIKGISQYKDTEQIKRFLMQKFKVRIYQVSVVYDFRRKFEGFVDYDILKTELQMEKLSVIRNNDDDKNIKKLQKKIFEFQQKMKQQKYQAPGFLYFIVHFQTISQMNSFTKVLQSYYLVDQWSYRLPKAICCACCFNQIPNQLKFRQKDQIIIMQRKCGRPQDIIWENLDIHQGEKFIRTLVGTVIIIILLILTSITIAICSIYVSSTQHDCSSYVVTTSFQEAKLSANVDTVYCYCSNNIFYILNDIDKRNLCQSVVISQVLQVIAAMISTITNILLTILVNSIVKFMKPRNKSEGYVTSFIYILFATIINSIALPLLINGQIFEARPVFFFKFINFLDFSKLISYSDFTRDWYAYVAPYYLNFFLFGIISPWISLITTCILEQFKRYRLRNKQGQIIQKIMNQQLNSYEFDLPVASATLLLYITFALVYSSSLPILIPLAVVILISHYICNKYLIINYTKQISINQQINKKILNFFPIILIIHVAFGIWAYTCSDIFSNAVIIQNRFLNIRIFGGQLDRIFYIDYMLAVLIIIIGGIVLDSTLIKLFNFLGQCCTNSTQIANQEVNVIEQRFSKRLQHVNILGSYNLENNSKYNNPIKLMKNFFTNLQLNQTQFSLQNPNQIMVQNYY